MRGRIDIFWIVVPVMVILFWGEPSLLDVFKDYIASLSN